mmetsp:Transcript_41461/g.125555  ORF Transcript_41461/g.125555 Transcript_41461/m.125555 type:complete len:217 (+) Transcript_41461:530-1180(+)
MVQRRPVVGRVVLLALICQHNFVGGDVETVVRITCAFVVTEALNLMPPLGSIKEPAEATPLATLDEVADGIFLLGGGVSGYGVGAGCLLLSDQMGQRRQRGHLLPAAAARQALGAGCRRGGGLPPRRSGGNQGGGRADGKGRPRPRQGGRHSERSEEAGRFVPAQESFASVIIAICTVCDGRETRGVGSAKAGEAHRPDFGYGIDCVPVGIGVHCS